jgi:hypothetical protein
VFICVHPWSIFYFFFVPSRLRNIHFFNRKEIIMLPALIAQIGVPALAALLSSVLGSIKHPAAQAASKALGDLGSALTRGEISPDDVAEANRHTEAMLQMQIQQDGSALADINESLRAEVASGDAYVRRMRPTFGYIMAVTWLAQMLAVAWVIVFRTMQVPMVLQGLESLSFIWTVGLSVLGVYVYKRSEEKQAGV